MISVADFQANLAAVNSRINAACAASGRQRSDVELLAVTKTHPAEAIRYAAEAGLRGVGENRVQEGVEKRAQATVAIRWELIGHLQSNKARLAAEHFDRIQSVDSEKLLRLLDRAAGERGSPLPILLQINAGRDPAKFGAELEDAPRLTETALAMPNLRLEGLMTIAPLSGDSTVAHRTFSTLRELRDTLSARHGIPLRELSMGMTGDLEAAIAAGSTLIRVGSALFGSRG